MLFFPLLCCHCSLPRIFFMWTLGGSQTGHCCLTRLLVFGFWNLQPLWKSEGSKEKTHILKTYSHFPLPIKTTANNQGVQTDTEGEGQHLLFPCRTHWRLWQGPLNKGRPHLRVLSSAASPNTTGPRMPCFQKDASLSFRKMFPSQRWAVKLFLEFPALGT